MKILTTGRQIGKAVKNVQRLRQILAVFAKYGFVDLVERMNLSRFLTSGLRAIAEQQSELSTPVRLRLAFEELGPTFVKLGQLLSTRPDLLPESYIEEFVRLQDNVQPLPFEIVKNEIERELKRPLMECFAAFDPTPHAAASIGQVHLARLHSGAEVVVKVQRPDIDKTIRSDISLLEFLAGLLEKYIPETRVVNPRVFVQEFFRTLNFELDFMVEANNMAKIAKNMESIPEIVIPKLYKQLSTSRILTEERLVGLRVNDSVGLDAAGVDRKKVVELGARAFFRSVMIDGLFHGDLHAGNLFILPGNRLGIIDFGIVGRLSQNSRDRLAAMVMALMTEDFETLCYQYAELGATSASIDFDDFQRDVRNQLAPYLGLALDELNVGRVLIEGTRIAARHHIRVPGDWMIVFKAILTLESMGRNLDPKFDLLAMGQELIKDLVKKQYAPERLAKDLFWVGKEVVALMQVLPRQLRWMLRKFNSNDFAFEIKSPELERIRMQLEINGRRSNLTYLTIAAFCLGTYTVYIPTDASVFGIPLLSWIFFSSGLGFLFRLFLRSFR